jgi:hypothetical protein
MHLPYPFGGGYPGRAASDAGREPPGMARQPSAPGPARAPIYFLVFSAQAASTRSLCGRIGQCSSLLPDSSQ